jgi:tetratricopeptide (TPR) repeat protein
VGGAWLQYETDYWGNSVRQAVEWIQANAEPRSDRPVRIRLWYGDQVKAKYYIEKQPGFEHVIAIEDSSDWDYQILQTVECKYNPQMLREWPPSGTVYEVRADGTPLTAVRINFRNRRREEVLEPVQDWAGKSQTRAVYDSLASMLYRNGRYDESAAAFRKAAELEPGVVGRTHDAYMATSTNFYKIGKYEESIMASRLALEQRPKSTLAQDKICAAYGGMEQWEEAKRACETALDLTPGSRRVREHLDAAIRQLSRSR